jgi:hypothetical protein
VLIGTYWQKICVWINPYIAQESAIFDEAAQNGYFIKKTDGSVWQYDFWVYEHFILSLILYFLYRINRTIDLASGHGIC